MVSNTSLYCLLPTIEMDRNGMMIPSWRCFFGLVLQPTNEPSCHGVCKPRTSGQSLVLERCRPGIVWLLSKYECVRVYIISECTHIDIDRKYMKICNRQDDGWVCFTLGYVLPKGNLFPGQPVRVNSGRLTRPTGSMRMQRVLVWSSQELTVVINAMWEII